MLGERPQDHQAQGTPFLLFQAFYLGLALKRGPASKAHNHPKAKVKLLCTSKTI
jgi:hypothetical protein